WERSFTNHGLPLPGKKAPPAKRKSKALRNPCTTAYTAGSVNSTMSPPKKSMPPRLTTWSVRWAA
ncbi:MAG: hypothetical protein, partial [Olavius algarvensis Delta 4 endosymbiont]